ncbi:MAG TPA: DUF3592 domain-containing protein [Pseudolabrys sp.]|jgi:hypothetical protein|nr:DUF3592 domain-containing protein [Pseudolabrys sp.]
METTPKISAQRTKRQSLAFARNLIVLAALIFAPGLWGVVNGALTLRWPRTTATIVDSDLRRFSAQMNSGSGSNKERDEWNSYSAHYHYSVGGKEYFAGRVEPYDFGMQNSAGAEKMRQRHPVGSTAQIAYDSDDAQIAYLEPGPSSFSLALAGLGAFMGLCGFWVRSLAKRGLGRMET